MSFVSECQGRYTSLIFSIHNDLQRWQCIHGEMPDAIFLSGEARYLLGRELLVHDPSAFATQPLYPVPGPVVPPVRERYETLLGIRVYQYHAEGIEYYFASKGAYGECGGL